MLHLNNSFAYNRHCRQFFTGCEPYKLYGQIHRNMTFQEFQVDSKEKKAYKSFSEKNYQHKLTRVTMLQ